jgi:hypothetical protein
MMQMYITEIVKSSEDALFYGRSEEGLFNGQGFVQVGHFSTEADKNSKCLFQHFS